MPRFSLNSNALYVGMDGLAPPPKLGFFGAIEASYKEDQASRSLLGAEVALANEEESNVQRIRDLGETAPALLDRTKGIFGTGSYSDYLRSRLAAREAAPEDEGRAGFVADAAINRIVGERDKQLRALQEKYPNAGIKTYSDMYSDIVKKAETDRDKWRSADTSFMGSIGGFIGSLASGFNPATNPFNVMTSVFAGGGTIAARMAAQAGIQSATEGANQLFGSADAEAYLGGDRATTDQRLLSVLGAGVGGAVLQGGGEALGRLFRLGATKLGARAGRWFRAEEGAPPPPPEPAPAAREVSTFKGADATLAQYAYRDGLAAVLPSSDLGETAVGRAIFRRDMDTLASRLASWSEAPWSLEPPGTVRSEGMVLPSTRDIGAGDNLPASWRAVAEATDYDVNAVARNLDKPTFVAYDKLTKEIAAARRDLGYHGGADALEAQKAELEAKIATLTKEAERKGTLQAIDQISEKIENLRAAAKRRMPAPEAQERLKGLQAKQQKLYPVIARAYARAQGLWSLYDEQAQAVRTMVETGQQGVDPFGFSMGRLRSADATPRATVELSQAPGAAVVPRAGETMTQAVERTVQEGLKQLDNEVAQFQQQVSKMLTDAAEKGVITVEGGAPLKLTDELTVPNLDGNGERTITVKQLLEETQEDLDTFNAVGSCSIAKTS